MSEPTAEGPLMAADGVVPSGALDPGMSALLKPLVDVIVAEIPDGEELREEFERGLIVYGEGLLQSARAVLQQARQERDEAYETLGKEHEFGEAIRQRLKQAEAQLAAQDAALQALEAVDEWRGLDGDGISDPVRQQVLDAVASVRAARSKEGK